MYKKIVLIMMLLSLLTVTVATAAAPAKITSVQLLSIAFKEEKGVMFKFAVQGDVTKTDLRSGTLFVDGKFVKLHCSYNAKAHYVWCTAPGGTAKSFAGKWGVVSFGGFTFSVTIPAKGKGL
jgi:hypothetical protein